MQKISFCNHVLILLRRIPLAVALCLSSIASYDVIVADVMPMNDGVDDVVWRVLPSWKADGDEVAEVSG